MHRAIYDNWNISKSIDFELTKPGLIALFCDSTAFRPGFIGSKSVVSEKIVFLKLPYTNAFGYKRLVNYLEKYRI